jgi:RNA polymerase sigma-70 factor (ECF subfamily)
MLDLEALADQNLSSLSDADLVVAALANQEAFAGLIDRYRLPLARYLRRIGSPDPEELEDLLQDIFIKAYLNLNDFDQSLKFSSWLYRIAHNQAIDFWRRKKSRPAQAVDPDDLFWLTVADEFDLEGEASQRELAGKIRLAIDRLEGDYRAVLVLRFLEEKDYQEIADILKKPPGTVATLINRAKIKLKKILDQANPETYGKI